MTRNATAMTCLCLSLTALLLAGCTTEAWYEGVKRSAEDRCRRDSPDSQRCLDNLNKQSYDAYEKERAATRQGQ